MDLSGKVALVTGASSGIGQAIAIALAQKHAHLLVHYGKNRQGAEDTLRAVEKTSRGALCQADLMTPAAVTSLFADIRRTTPAIDLLVNNAGDAQAGALGDDAMWDYELQNILMSAVRVTREFLAMPAARPRKIVNISSIYGTLHGGNPDYLQYSAFKAALANMTITLNKSLAPDVIVNAVAPGYTETPAWAGAAPEIKQALAQTTSIKRFVTAQEVAHAVVFIAENDAMSGQVLTLDGGM